jgi:hypothetical protein
MEARRAETRIRAADLKGLGSRSPILWRVPRQDAPANEPESPEVLA